MEKGFLTSKESIKEKIRARYRQGAEGIECMEAAVDKGIFDDGKDRFVAIYARVSTGDPRQVSSYEMQKSYYTDLVDRQSHWYLVDIYADEGISGTSLKKREQFKRMIADCLEGKKGINLIIVKTVARFARNVEDAAATIKKLAKLTPPIGVYFEMENLHSLNKDHEFSINIIASMAQDESRNKSSLMERSIEIRFKNGVFLTPELLGYDLDEDGSLVINEDEAKTVRLIFYMYLYGYSCAKIAEIITDLERTTKKGNTVWAAGSILQILQNERHCGDIVARKTFTRDYKEHTKRKNTINPETQKFYRNKYSKKDHHDAIVSREDFIAVQRLIANAKYGNKGILPQLKVITEGALQGFVSVNPRWAAFDADDYIAASLSAYSEDEQPTQRQTDVEVQSGDFDFRGYQVVRAQFFNTSDKKCLTFTTEQMWFGLQCLRIFEHTLTAEILVHPTEHLLAVRPCAKDNRNAVRWAKIEGDKYVPRQIQGTAFLKTLYALFDWDFDCKYRVRGIRRKKDNEAVLIFDMREIEVLVPASYESEGKAERAFPPSMLNGFGTEHYELMRPRETAAIDDGGRWDITAGGQPFHDEISAKVTSPESLADNIKNIMHDIGQGEIDEN